MPRAHDPRNIGTDRLPANVIGGPIPDQGWANARDAIDDPVGFFINQLLQQIKDTTGIDLFWMLDWSWTTNTILELVRQANDLMAWLQNPIQRPPNLLARPSFSSPSAIAAAPDWFWDAVVSVGTVAGPDGRPRTDPQGSARTTADGVRHALLSNPISGAAVAAGQILTCQMRALVEDGFTAADDQAICLELVPSRAGVLGDPVVLAHCGVPTDDPTDWIAAPVGSKAVFFDVDYRVPTEDVPDTIELRPVVNESAGGGVPVRFDGARVAAAGGFLVVLADLFDAGREYLTDLWTAITDWLADMSAWAAFVSASDAAWTAFVQKVKRALRHADADSYVPPSTSGIISDALKNNEWFGWLFTMVDDWLQPVLTIGKAATDFGDALWQAVTVFAAAPGAAGAWSTLTAAITAAWNTLVDTVLAAWGSPKTHADFASPGTATEAALKNNPVIGWVFELDGLLDAFVDVAKAGWDSLFGTSNYDGSFTDAWNALMDKLGWSSAPTKTIGQVGSAVGSNLLSTWVHSITDPIDDFFDSVRKYINQMIEGLHWGYFDTNWVWVPSLTTPNADKPTGDPVMTPGRNDDTTPAISSGADATIPGKPTGLVAIPWLDLTVSGFPAGKITYAIAAVKNGIEGPAAMVSAFAGTLVPPNTFGRVDLAYSAPAGGADSYRIYREVDATYEAQSWRLVATPTSDYPVLTPPLSDKTVRTSGVTAHPKTDAELAAQIVTSVKSTADGAQGSANAIQAGLYGGTPSAPAAVGSTIDVNAVPTDIPPAKIAPVGAGANLGEDVTAAVGVASNASDAAATAILKFNAVPEKNIVVANVDPQIVPEDWGVGLLPVPSGANTIVSGTQHFESTDGIFLSSNPTSSSRSVMLKLPPGFNARAVLIFLSWTSRDITSSIPTAYTAPSSGVNFNNISNSTRKFASGWDGGGCSVFMASNVNISASGSGLPIYVGIANAGTLSQVYTLDAWMMAVDGTPSGEFVAIKSDYPVTSVDADADSVAIVHNSLFRYKSLTDLTIDATAVGMTANHTMSNLLRTTSSDTVTHSAIALTKNIDAAETLAITTTPTAGSSTSTGNGVVGVGMGIVLKSLVPPQTDTIGSYAEISTANPNAFTQTVGSFNPFTNFNEVVRYSPDITVDETTASVTVDYIGTYDVAVDLLANETHDMTLAIAVNGVIVAARRCSGYSMTINALVYAKQGDVISLQVKNNVAGNITLDTVSRMAITLVNRSYL